MKARVAWLIAIVVLVVAALLAPKIRRARYSSDGTRVVTETGDVSVTTETAWSTGTVPAGVATVPGSTRPIVPETKTPALAAPTALAPARANEERAAISPQSALENLRVTIRLYGSTFGGNPVGTNLEITRALNGDNPRHIHFLDGARLNAKGELVDDWGTPYFFHQLSGHETEIRSAGPDKRMWTGDDIVMQ